MVWARSDLAVPVTPQCKSAWNGWRCSSTTATLVAAPPDRRRLGNAGRVAGAAYRLRSRRHSMCVQKPPARGGTRMLHRGRVQLLHMVARHRARIMIDTQVLVDLGCAANTMHTLRISQWSSPAPSPLLVFARLFLCLTLFGELSSAAARP